MRKTQRNILISFIMVVALGYYSFLLLLTFFPERNYSSGKALSAVVQLAFGQTRVLQSYTPYAALNQQAIQDGCLIKRPKAGAACVLASEGAANDLYLRKCGWWWFQECADITVDPLFLKHPELNQALQKILKNPCAYLPSAQILFEERKKEKHRTIFSYHLDIALYDDYRRILNCDGNKTKKIKVIQAYRNEPDDTANVFTITLGGNHAR
jgi:hypothetical protein